MHIPPEGSESTAHPSGHCDGLSRDVGSILGAQERNHPSNFLWLSNSEVTDQRANVWNLIYEWIVHVFVHRTEDIVWTSPFNAQLLFKLVRDVFVLPQLGRKRNSL